MGGPLVFTRGRGGPVSADMVARIVTEAAESTGFGFHAIPICSSAGHMLADDRLDTGPIYDFLGDRDYSEDSLVRQMSPHRTDWRARG
jgi:hypothetical protein